MKEDYRNHARHGRAGITQFWDDFVLQFNEICGFGPVEARSVKQCKNKIDMLRKQYRNISSELSTRTGNDRIGPTIDESGNLVVYNNSGQIDKAASVSYWPTMVQVFQIIPYP